MSRMLLPLSFVSLVMGSAAFADAPRVAVDIAPIHSLVARVMDGVGTPDLIVQSGASPHEYALRPSEAAALQNADLVFWVGPDLTPWLDDAIKTLAEDATVTALLETEGTLRLEVRKDALFEAHDHGEDDHDHDHAHEDHSDHADDGPHDAHAWLSPQNAANWLNVIAAELSTVDPQNADAYSANAAAGRDEINALIVEIDALLAPVQGTQFVVFHDAYQYFETAFEFTASGAISIGDASDPSPARIAEIRTRIADQGIDCVLAEPQFNPGLAATVLDGTDAKTSVLDPLGSDLTLGPALYPQLMRNLAVRLADCR